jgi:hypothetical protein
MTWKMTITRRAIRMKKAISHTKRSPMLLPYPPCSIVLLSLFSLKYSASLAQERGKAEMGAC